MPQLAFTFDCPLEGLTRLKLVIDVGMTQTHYLEGIAAGEYRALLDIPNWCDVMGDAPPPQFPLTTETIGALPFVLIRYISSGQCVGDALTAYMEARSPN